MKTFAIDRYTSIVLGWITHNGYEQNIAKLPDVKALKQWVSYRLKPMNDSCIKGAKLIDWQKVFDYCQEVNKI